MYNYIVYIKNILTDSSYLVLVIRNYRDNSYTMYNIHCCYSDRMSVECLNGKGKYRLNHSFYNVPGMLHAYITQHGYQQM